MKKWLTFLFCIVYFFHVSVVQAAEISPSTNLDWKSKLDARLVKAIETTNEKIPVWLWMEDIDQSQAKETVYKNTGLRESNLNVISETISEEMVAKLTDYSQLNANEQQNVKGEMQSYLTRTKAARKLEAQRVNTYLQELRAVQDTMLAKKNQTIYSQLGFAEKDIIIEQTGSPMYVVQLTKDEIIKAAKSQKVTGIYYYDMNPSCEDEEDNTLGDNSLESSLNATTLQQVQTEVGIEGTGVKVGFIESGRTKSTSSTVASTQVTPTILPSRITNLTYVENEADGYYESVHATQVAEIAVGENGVAREASVYSFALGLYASNKVERFINAINLMRENGVNVINMSMHLGDVNRSNEPYTGLEMHLDYLVKTKKFTFVKSAGNITTSKDDPNVVYNNITSPGLAYNAITAGGYFNRGSLSTDDDVMFSQSCFNHLSGCTKPDFISNQISFKTNTGTSYAAPVVTGIVALLFELQPSLQAQPEAVKAILMASCHRRVKQTASSETPVMSSGLDNHQGAGAIDPYTAIAIAGSEHYGIRNLPGSSVYTTNTIQIYQPPYNANGLNVSIAWSVTNPNQITQGNSLNLNLKMMKNSNVLGGSYLNNSSSEMVYVTSLNNNGNYTITIDNFGQSGTPVPIRYAYAFSIDKQNYQYTNVSEGYFYLKNKATGKYLTIDGSGNVVSGAFSGNAVQQWLLYDNYIYTIQNERRITIGSLITNGYKKAIASPSAGTLVIYQWNQQNYQKDGSITFYHPSTGMCMGLYAPNTNNEIIAWSEYDSNNEYQKWYLEPVAYQRGDVDFNGCFEQTDYLTLRPHVYNSAPLSVPHFIADVNGDSYINLLDIEAIQAFVTTQ